MNTSASLTSIVREVSWLAQIGSLTGALQQLVDKPSDPARLHERKTARQVEPLEHRLLLAADVFTDQVDYAPGQTAHIYASDFAVGEAVQFQVLHIDGTSNTGNGHSPWTVVDGSVDDLDGAVNGNIHTTWYVDPDDSADSTFELTAQGLTSGAMAATVFTDDGNDTPTNITTQPGWLDVNGSNPVTVINAPAGFVITKVAIKSGSNSFAVPDPNNVDPGDDNTGNQHSGVITVNGTYGLGNGFTVSGLGTSTVTVTKNAGTKDISHVDYFLGTAPQGRIIVEKQTNPDGSIETFEFDPSYAANFNLSDGQQNNSGVLAPGSYTVQELAKLGWDLTNIQIVSGDTDNGSTIGGDADFDAGDTTATIDLDAGETITVRFTNTQRGRIIVEKQTNPDGSVEPFEFDPSYAANFNLSDGQQNNSGLLTPGSYTVQELAKLGWDLTNIQIVSGDTDNGSTIGGDADFDAGDNTATIDLDAGETITVRFTNTQRGRIIVEKQTNPDGSVETFEFDPSYAANFNLSDGQQNNSGVLAPGSYTVQELAKLGWDLTNIQIVSGDSDNGSTIGGDADFDAGDNTATIDLDAGETITVRFTNTQRGRIIVEKQTNPDGSVETFEFDPSYAANFNLSDGQQNNSGVLAPGSYTVQELAKLGWDLTNIQIVSGDTDNGSTIGGDADFDAGDNTATIDLDAGETITVRFTNTKDRPVIVIGPDKGNKSAPIIKIVDKDTGEILSQFYVYEPSFMGGVRIATGDMTGDGIEEIIVAPGQGRSPEVRVFTQAGVELTQFRTLAYDVSHQGGVEVAVGDVNGDGKNDIVTTPTNARTQVRVFYNNYDSGMPLADPIFNTPGVQFYVFDSKFKGGADVTVADVGTFLNGGTVNASTPDGKGEIIVGSGPGMRATVHVFDVTGPPTIVDTILPFDNKFKGGVTLSAARVNADAIPDLIIAAGNKGGSLVQVYSGLTNDSPDALLAAFATFADTSTKNMPVHATTIDTNGDGIADILAAVQGTNGKSNQIRCFEMDGTFIGALSGFNGPWNIASLNNLDPNLPAGAANLVANDLLFSLLGDSYAKPKKKKK